MIGYANTVSILRMLLCFLVAGLLFVIDANIYWACFFLTIAVIWMDGLDGFLARKFNESSKLGAVLDILCDRVVEQVYWVTFLGLGWLPVWIPLVVIVRGVLVDGIRAVALEQGYTAFGSSTMMKSPMGVLLVSSRFSRWTYAVAKAVAFSLMILTHIVGWDTPELIAVTWLMVYVSVFFCVVRGLPVLVEGLALFKK
jgi:CDP-diacylglycerol--glycerol-3-phosphate 3-phosphatidyltransferase